MASSSGVNIFGARVLIDGGLMRIIVNSVNDSSTSSSSAFQSRQCIQMVEGSGFSSSSSTSTEGQPMDTAAAIKTDRKFIVLYRERNSSLLNAATASTKVPRLYQCIQFVRRADAIFQVSSHFGT